MQPKRIVIIGAGIVGSSLAYFLSKMGQQNITVIEQGPLVETGGSTSHAPGLVFQLSFSKVMTKLANSTANTFKELSTEDLQSFYTVGSLEVANTPERLEDLKRKAGVGASWGMEAYLLTPEECSEKCSLIDPTTIYGGLFVPSDGIAKPLNAVGKMMDFAKSHGVKFYGETEVIDIDVQDCQVKKVVTSSGDFEADLIVCCAGFWGPRIGEMVGVTIPLQPMAHQFVWTEDLKEFARETEEVTAPIIRHQDSALYYRQVFNRLGVGSYQHRPLPVEVDEITKYGESKEMPSVKAFTPEDFEKPWQDAINLMPSLKETSITKGINGIFSFTPDEMPLLGESHKVKGFWVAEAIWVTHSAGVAKEMAEWIVNGVPTLDLELCDINRFDDYAQSPSFYKARSIENYVKVYDIHHPYMPHETGRNIRVSPFYIRQEVLGAVYDEKAGWEQPQWYEANQSLVSTYEKEIIYKKNWAAQFWSPVIEAEQIHVQKFAGLFDVTASRKYLEISGEGTIGFMQQLTTSNIDIPIGTFTKTFMLNESAGIKDEITVIRKGESAIIVLCSGAVEASWIKKNASGANQIVINDFTAGMCSLLIKGSKTREFMQSVLSKHSEGVLEIRQAKQLFIEHVPVLSIYNSLNDSETWELFATADQGLGLWDILCKEGKPYQLIAAGERALDGLRIESLLPKPGKDFWSEMTPYEIGFTQMVDLEKQDFIGKKALLDSKLNGPKQLLTTLVLDDPSIVIMGHEPVFYEERSVGFVTSFGYSYERKTGVVFALLSPDVVKEGSKFIIKYFGEHNKATIISQSVFITH
ncbi:FAD-dependent oxidoreductase [Bacillus sp. 03113]|uniref:GcvT family protein n=1 Tax=Bacillus sp. 03113 TaxID=2578211 RepID=UPI001143D016|nr:FAD-dependent oxidoreductase [Bacillus sp. 03113]